MESLFRIGDFMPSEAKCVRALRKMRWGKDGVTCPKCNSKNIISFGRYHRNNHMHRYRCKSCKRTFSETTGTIFENSKIPLNEWVYIAWALQRNTSMNQIHKDTGIAYQHIMHAANKIMDNVFMKRLIQLSGEDIEIDELYQSAGRKGTKQADREPRKRGLKLKGRGTYDKDKPPIVAAVERGGGAVMEVFRNLNKKNLDAFLYFVTGNFVHTDDYRIYDHLDSMGGFVHVSTNHSDGDYSKAYIHNNTAEGIFCDLRTWLRRYKGVCKEHLYRFVALFQFNLNHRDLNPMQMFTALLTTLLGR